MLNSVGKIVAVIRSNKSWRGLKNMASLRPNIYWNRLHNYHLPAVKWEAAIPVVRKSKPPVLAIVRKSANETGMILAVHRNPQNHQTMTIMTLLGYPPCEP
jgi:hypothetical protein